MKTRTSKTYANWVLIGFGKNCGPFTNPKRGKSMLRFNGYRGMIGHTVAEVITATDITPDDIRWDVERSNICLQDPRIERIC